MTKEESFEELKYLLGHYGIEILMAIEKGARSFETIKLFSGLPEACIRGRIPVLSDFGLIIKANDEYFLTKKGFSFRNKLS